MVRSGAADRRCDDAAQGGVEIGADVRGGHAEPGRAARIDADAQLGRVALETGIEVDEARHIADPGGSFGRLCAQRRVVVAEKLHLDRPRRA